MAAHQRIPNTKKKPAWCNQSPSGLFIPPNNDAILHEAKKPTIRVCLSRDIGETLIICAACKNRLVHVPFWRDFPGIGRQTAWAGESKQPNFAQWTVLGRTGSR